MTDKVARVFAAMAAGGGTAVTIGPPSTTAEATALAACVVAMAVAEVDAVTGLTADGTVEVVAVVAAVDAVNVIGVVAVDGEESNAVADADVDAAVVVTATVAAPTVFTEPLSGGGRATSFGGVSVFADAAATATVAAAAVAVDCFLGKRGDNLTGGRLTVGLFPATALATGCVRLGVLGDLVGSGDFGGTAASLRGVGGNFLRGDDLTAAAVFAGTVGGLPAAAGVFRPAAAPPPVDCLVDEPDVRFPATDRSLVDADSCLPPAVVVVAAGGRRPSARAIRGSDV